MCDSDRNERRINELLKKTGNDTCADCSSREVEYGSYNLGVFLCTICASVHLKIGIHISKVKSLRLARWNDDQIEMMENLGNTEVNKKYLKHLPVFYRKPVPDDPNILLEQYIRAKYERMEFIHVDKQKYNKANMDNILLVKKKKDDDSFVPRRFILSDEANSLTIYPKEDAKAAPKVSIPLPRINICLSPSKLNLENSMQLTFIEDGLTRHIFVSHETGEELINWYMAIRHAKLLNLFRAFPAASYQELVPYLTKDFLMEGWVSKTGPADNDSYRKRWLTLDRRNLMYHYGPMDVDPRGEIFLGHRSEKYDICDGASGGSKEMGFVFSLMTPDRTFNFSVATAVEKMNWMNVIGKVLDSPLNPQDIQSRNLLDPDKRRAARHSWFHF